MMHNKKWLFLLINLLGGLAVLTSYAIGFLRIPSTPEILWGGVPISFRPIYTANMFLAATGYFAFTYFLLFRLDPMSTKVNGRFGFGLFNIIFAAILFPSATWLPLTFLAVNESSIFILWIVKTVLAVVGLASLGLFFSLWYIKPHPAGWAYRITLVGCGFFCLQTAILDAIIWSALFRF